MKIDAMTGLAVAFAGFAAWYTLKPGAARVAAPAPTAADLVFGQAQAQRQESGNSLYQNTDALNFTIYQPIDPAYDYFGLKNR